MENEKLVKYNTFLGILFAIGGAILGLAVWLGFIALLGMGTAGMIGGAFAAVLGMLVAGAYRTGRGRPGIVGIIFVVPITFVAAAVVVTVGTAFILTHHDMAYDVFNGLDVLTDALDSGGRLASAFFQDFFIAVGIAVVTSIVSVAGGRKKKQATQEEVENEDSM